MTLRLLLPPLAFFALAAGAAAAGGTSKEIGGKVVHLRGTKIYYSQGKAVAPRSISVSVAPKPSQPVKVQWAVVCQKPNSADPAIQVNASGTSGQSSVHGVATVKLKLPYAAPPNCIATVYATLARNGSLVLRILQT